MSTPAICTGRCTPAFAKALRKKFGNYAELPLTQMFDMKKGKWYEIVTPPEVRVREGRRWFKTRLMLPYCGVCGKKTS